MSKINTRLAIGKNRLLALLGLGLLVALSLAGPLSAQSVTQGYKSDQSLQRGMLVAVSLDDPAKVEALTSDSLDRAKGVVVQPNDSPVTLSSDDRKIFVASSGEFDVLVSDQNGKIKKGGYISISALEGIGMKAAATQTTVVGRATETFAGSGDTIGASVDKSDKAYNIGRITAQIAIGSNPQANLANKSNVPQFLVNAGETVADKPVSSFRIYLSLALFLATIGVAGLMLYGGVRSSLIAIGRNPLSKRTITRGLFQVILMSLLIFITGTFGVYLLLKL
jgi:hypothetical protein